MRNMVGLQVATLVLVSHAPAWASQVPVVVSPGSPTGAVIESRCPTFSWDPVDRATGHELVVYEVGEDEQDARPVLKQEVPGSASSWTPPLDSCLARGGQYAWSVRAVGQKAASEWSAPSLFEVAARPSEAEFETALEVVKSYLAVERERAESVSDAKESTAVGEPERPSTGGAPGTRAAPAATQLSVDGNIDATSFSGDGQYLANVATDAELVAHGLGNAHDSRYFTKDDLMNSQGNGAVHWLNLTNRPPGLDDGDDDTLYSAGPGLVLSGTQFSLGSYPTLPTNNALSFVDSEDGRCGSVTIGVDGLPVIGYLDQSFKLLKVAKCNDVACAGGDETISGVAATGLVFGCPSVALGDDGLPVISLMENKLWVVKCDDADCAGGDESIVELGTSVSFTEAGTRSSSIMLASDGLPVVSYLAPYIGFHDLRVAKCDDSACVGGGDTVTTLEVNFSGVVTGSETAIILGTDGFPVISYFARPSGVDTLKVAKCDDVGCTGGGETISVVDGAGGRWNSITLGSDGLPVISYAGANGLQVAKCNDSACSGSDETISNIDSAVGSSSISVGADGYPVIGYHQPGSDDLKVAKCNDTACAGGDETITTLDFVGKVGANSTITVAADGLPLLVYDDDTNPTTRLKAARCANPFCLPYFRRR